MERHFPLYLLPLRPHPHEHACQAYVQYLNANKEVGKRPRDFSFILDTLMKTEDRKKGTVSFSTYMRYCKAAGG